MNDEQLCNKRSYVNENENFILILTKELDYEYRHISNLENLLGFSPDSFRKVNLLNYIYPKDKKNFISLIDDAFKDKKPSLGLRFEDFQGKYIWFKIRAKKIEDKDHKERISITGSQIERRNALEINTKLEKEDISLKSNLKKERDQNEGIFKKIAEAARDAIFLIDEFGKVLYWNKASERIYGYKSEEILRKEFYKFIIPRHEHRDFKKIMQNFRNTLKDSSIGKTTEYVAIRKDGTKIPIEVSYSSIELKNKWYILGVVRDITNRKLAQKKLKDSEEKYRLISENANDLISILNRNLKLEYVNENALNKILGYSVQDVSDMKPLDFLPESEAKKAAKALRKGIMNEEVTQELRVKQKDGNLKCLEVKGKVFIDHTGERKGLLICRDISERKHTEENLKKSEQYYRLITENANDLIRVLNNKLEIEYINEKVHKKILGYEKDDLIGKNIISVLNKEDILKQKRDVIKNFKSGLGSHEIRHKHKKGHFIWVEVKGKHFILNDGKKKTLIIGREITDRKIQDELRKEQLRKLNEINKIKTDLLRRTSHELKTPLISIKGYTDLFLELNRDSLDSKNKSIIEEIKDGCRRLEDLIEDLINSSRLESDEIKIDKKSEDLVFLIRFALQDLKALIRNRNHNITLDLHKELITKFEKEKIYEVLTNLMTNAIKYTPPNGLIKIQSIRNPNEFIICIEDDGIGLTKQERKIIFKQFGKIERYGQGWDIESQGTGLGLYIVKKIVDLHQGRVWVESEGRNKGSKFFFSIPVIK